jgi:ABC-type cobalamin/Fe3+-siderophores transport system ATPase subunit
MDKKYHNSRGSEWKKWDLHLHSFYTSVNNQFSPSTEDDYINKIISDDIKVVGLTNYFSFSDNDWNLKSNLEAKGILVFLNLELRLTYTNREDDCCDLHLIFSNDLTRQDIETFLTKLNCSVSGAKKTLRAVTTDADKKIAVVEFSEVIDILADSALTNLKSKVLIGMLSRGKGDSRSSTMYESLTIQSDFIIHSSSSSRNVDKDIEYWSGNSEEKPFKFKALFQSSDAHHTSEIGVKFSWVKGDSSFETLRQAVVDHDNRVLIQERNPSEKKNSSPELFIDKVEYKQGGKVYIVPFSKDLNTVIGKRGAGKSVLLKHIVFNVLGGKEIKKLSEFKIYWCDNTIDNKFVEYIPQNYLSAITYEDGEKYDERDSMLRTRLFNNDLFKNADANKTDATNSIELKINGKIKDVLNLHKQIVDTTNQLKPLGKSEDKDKAIAIKQEEIKKLGKINITNTDISNQSKYSSEITSLTDEIKLLEQDIQIIKNISTDDEVNFITVDDQALFGLSQTTLDLIQKHIEQLSSQDIKIYLGSLLADLAKRVKAKKEAKVVAEKNLEPITIKLQQNKTVEKVLNEVNKLDEEKKEIDKLDKFITNSKAKKLEIIEEITDLYLSFKVRIEAVVETLKNEFSDFTFITFDFTVSYDIFSYKNRFFDVYIDGRSGERFKKFITDDKDFSKVELTEIIKDIIDDVDTAKLKTTGGNKESALVALLSCRYDIDFTKSVKYKNVTGLVDFENMTGGQKAMALLDLIFNLSKSVYPIIIDQPENDIDVSGISDDLKKLILDQKEKRQVIIATHSPNLLLLTDSENVIVAENNQNSIEYHNGGIEDEKIQGDIISILEGGKDALIKRMEKLNLG